MAGSRDIRLPVMVEEIPDSGIELDIDMPDDWLVELLGPQFFLRTGHAHLEVRLARAGRSVLATGRLTAALGFVCGRCAEEAPFALDHAFSHVFVFGHETGGLPEDLDENEDSLEFTFIEGPVVDLEPLAAEELVLALPQFPLCSESCKGICQHCGKNLNEGPCECEVDVVDPRWARLKEIKL